MIRKWVPLAKDNFHSQKWVQLPKNNLHSQKSTPLSKINSHSRKWAPLLKIVSTVENDSRSRKWIATVKNEFHCKLTYYPRRLSALCTFGTRNYRQHRLDHHEHTTHDMNERIYGRRDQLWLYDRTNSSHRRHTTHTQKTNNKIKAIALYVKSLHHH